MFIRAPGYFILCIANSTPSYFFGISLDPSRIWNLIEFFGLKAMDPLECQLIAFQAGEFISPEAMEEAIVTLRALVEAGCVFSFSSK